MSVSSPQNNRLTDQTGASPSAFKWLKDDLNIQVDKKPLGWKMEARVIMFRLLYIGQI